MRRIFTLVVTNPVPKVTDLFVHARKIVRSFGRGLVFKGGFTVHHNLIYHTIIVIDSSSVLTDETFIYFRLFTRTYVPPIRYVIYGEYHVSNKD